jgi:hypothetical protein
MILYHFTARDHAKAIEREGITKGAVYIPPAMFEGIIWLTDDPRFTAQNWATNYSGQCGDRTEVRFTLDIGNAVRWNDFALEVLKFRPRKLFDFNLAGGSGGEHWYIARAPIDRRRIIAKVYKGEV